eukprot:Plantae.Rhodophyta-Purpureofilum_apyrenoidigerum.ctg11793.p1 GENE.Plantae.Rhodophyta-Purpureofilum_apyrenoidigerum.ctg11793~~Plantae.Rhodophyta-Purpureofilum_apyrenoidigerum.ctg11793.p1  ORF type:complete len:320 (-),score=48.09 Plantae.Rhodophyta-Purpureofilum_apyrenoidigerum.ctg11793:90-1049(-)
MECAFVTLGFLGSKVGAVRENGTRSRVSTAGTPRRRMVVIRCAAEKSSEMGEKLVEASAYGDTKTVKELIEAGVYVDYMSTKNNSGMTALMWAASEGHAGIADELLRAKASVNVKNRSGFPAILYAFENAPTARPAEAPPAGFPDMPGRKQPKQAKIYRKETGHLGVAKQLLVSGADRNVKNPVTGDTLLHVSARRGFIGLVDLLLSMGLSPDVTNKGYLHTPLHEAVIQGHVDIVKLLLSKGAAINKENRVGWTPLIWAAARGNVEMVEFLCKAGADVNIKGEAHGNPGKRTTDALSEGSRSFNAAAVRRVLIKHGAK